MNLENEMWDKLKAEIKSELKEEIKAEILAEWKDEIVQSTMKKVDDMIFLERHFDTMLRKYIQSICYDDIYYQKMVILGKTKVKETTYEIPQFSEGEIWMRKMNNVSIRKLYEENTQAKIIDCSFDDFNSVINFTKSDIVIDWFDKKTKGITYYRLFDLFNAVYDYDFSDLSEYLEKRFINFLSAHFTFRGEIREPYLITKSFKVKYKQKEN